MSELKPIPRPLYSCAYGSCAEEYSWLAGDLWWSENKRGWYCDICFGEDREGLGERGTSLAEEIASRTP